jgi:YD repeat-containing protein
MFALTLTATYDAVGNRDAIQRPDGSLTQIRACPFCTAR